VPQALQDGVGHLGDLGPERVGWPVGQHVDPHRHGRWPGQFEEVAFHMGGKKGDAGGMRGYNFTIGFCIEEQAIAQTVAPAMTAPPLHAAPNGWTAATTGSS
jgi:hypothetical protein